MTKLIAEIGWNHMGDMPLAKEMISAAKENGADCAKFQTWSVSRLKSGSWDNDGRTEIYKKSELSLEDHLELQSYCSEVDIEFLSSVFSVEDAKLLRQVISNCVKIPSAESRNDKLLDYCFENFEHVYLSTGTSSWDEIRVRVNLPYRVDKVTLLHCVSSYPCTWNNSNINRIKHLKRLVSKVGFSDHSPDIVPSVLALTYGIDVIEKHFTIDNKLPGRDNENSILPSDLKKLKYFIDASKSILSLNEPSFQKCELDVRENYTGRFDG